MSLQKVVWLVIGLISFLYLLNPTFGFLELIPDNIPIIGNLDEGAAAILFVAALREFGIDLSGAFTGRSGNNKKIEPTQKEIKPHKDDKKSDGNEG
ncbi:MAG: DUF1232 domain-containing protein [Bernardetiaceae bacterium]|nr:DUF1232 domain-containing protein [Bernardetiaceae bacterium]